MPELKIELCSHFFRVTEVTSRARPAVVEFAKAYVQWGLMRVPRPGQMAAFTRAPLRVFGAATEDRTEYRFHIHQIKQFGEVLAKHNLSGDMIALVERPMYDPEKAEFVIQPHWKDYDYQEPVIEYLSKPGLPIQRLVELQTGKGKSYCCMRGVQNLGFRALLIVRPMYLDKWVEDLKKTYELKPGDVMVVQGGAQLMALIQRALDEDLTSKFIIVSNKTLQNFLKLYETMKDGVKELGYGCLPDEMYEVLKVGVRAMDEVHQDFHLNYKIDLYTHVPHSMSLSATLISDDAFLNKMYEIAYPSPERYKGGAYDRYIEARAISWRLENPGKVRTKEFGSTTYSHHAFEKSIMRDKRPNGMLANYLKLVAEVVKMGHFRQDYKPGNRCLLYFAGVEFCTIVTEYLQKLYPHLKVRRYVEQDPYENLMESDICVSTLISAGTGVDIPQLTTVILTTAVSSSPSNLQGFGRLRKLKDGTVPQFYYFVCEDIQKHIEYHERKRELFETRALNYKSWPMQGRV